MRADRLLSLLMLLQARGRMTAAALAEELEVTERTIYRDLTALSAAGVPVFTERGPGGGCALVESYRTTLTGLTPSEARALFMMSIPAPLLQLGVGQELKAALLKLSAALPDSRRQEESLARQRIHLDSSWWFQPDEATPRLEILQQAVWQDHYLHLKYRSNFGAEVEQEVAPYGLVAKANIWYLVYGWEERIRVVRVSRVSEAVMLPGAFIRPVDFDLAVFWKKWCATIEKNQPSLPVRARISPALLPNLKYIFGERTDSIIEQSSAPDAAGWVTMTLPFESFESARSRLLGLGRAVEVLEPAALRKSLIDFAEQILEFYKERGE